MTEDPCVPLSPLHAPVSDVFCDDCVFYAPLRPFHRCRHPSAATLVKTFAGYVTHRLEPEDKNAQNDCVDFRARTWWDTAFPLVGIPLLWLLWLLGGYVFAWLFAR